MKSIWIAILFYASLKIYVLKITPSRWLPFRRMHSSSRDLKTFMTSRSISTGIEATSSFFRCWSTHLKDGYPCFYRVVWWDQSGTWNIEMSAECAPSPHQILSILIISLNPFQPRDAIWHHAFHLFLICMPFAYWLQ